MFYFIVFDFDSTLSCGQNQKILQIQVSCVEKPRVKKISRSRKLFEKSNIYYFYPPKAKNSNFDGFGVDRLLPSFPTTFAMAVGV
jgi:hypothetical protein